MDEIKLPVHKGDNMACIYDAEGRYICGWKDEGDAEQIVSALNAQQPCGTCEGKGKVDKEGISWQTHKDAGTVPWSLKRCPDCTPCYGLSCPHWAQCFPQFKEEIKQLEAENKQAAGRIEKLENALRDVLNGIFAGKDIFWVNKQAKAALGEEKKDETAKR